MVGSETTATTKVTERVTIAKRPPRLSELRRVPKSLAGWGEAARSDFQRWFLMDRVRRVAFYGFARPGDTVDLEVGPLAQPVSGRRAYRAVGSVQGTRKVAAEFEGEVVALVDLENPEAMREAFARLTRARDW
jgi:hypothetical protein